MSFQFSVAKEIEFDAGHRVPLHSSKCRNPHGHRYKVVAHVRGDLQREGSSTGMVIDFGDIKRVLTEKVHDVFDHGFIIQSTDFEMLDLWRIHYDPEHMKWIVPHDYKVIVVAWTPTAEEMAAAVFAIVKQYIPGLYKIDVYETPTSIASFPG